MPEVHFIFDSKSFEFDGNSRSGRERLDEKRPGGSIGILNNSNFSLPLCCGFSISSYSRHTS